MEVGLGRASRKRSKRDAKAVWTPSVKVGDWVYREDRFVFALSVQRISWGMHRVTLKARSGTDSQIWPFGQDSLYEDAWTRKRPAPKASKPQRHQLLLAVKGLPQGTRPTVIAVVRQLCVRHSGAVELVIASLTKAP